MPAKAVADAVEARLSATWNGLPVIGANTAGDPPAASEFLTVQYPLANNARMAVNQGAYRQEGAFRIVLNVKRGHGAGHALTLCDQLGALFRDQKFGGVRTQVPSAPFIDDSNDHGKFFKVSMVFPYTFNF